MDVEFKSATTLVLAFIAFAFVFFKLINKPKTSPKHPPGPRKLPIIGNMHNLIGSLPHRTLHKLALKYGPVMHLQLGEVPMFLISSSEAAKEVLKTKDINFASRSPFILGEIIAYNCSSIGSAPYGDYWRQLRKICTFELLSPKRVQSFRSTREEVYVDLMKWIASNEGAVVNLSEKLFSTTVVIVSRSAFGEESPEKQKAVMLLKEALELGTHLGIADMFPSFGLLRVLSTQRRKLLKLHREADKLLERIIREHKEALENGSAGADGKERREDLVDVLLKFQGEENEVPLTNDNIKAVIVDILTGGSETSATLIDWTMAEMIKHPPVLRKAQEEVRRIFDEKGHVDESQINELKYLNSVIKEALRIHATLLLPRKCRQACEVQGYEIPVGAKVLVSPWTIHRDPKSWAEAEEFRPERFLENPVDYRGNDFDYIPFGAGRRMCPGLTFGLANVELPLAMFLYHFDWNLPDGMSVEDMDMGELSCIAFRRKETLNLVPVVRRPLPAE